MVVAPLTLTCLALATLFVAVLPIVLYRRLRGPLALSGRDVISGIAVFALFAMVIERTLNGYVLHQNETTAAWLSNPLAFVIYGAVAAGVCEEAGRFIAMRLMWRRAMAASATVGATAAASAVPGDLNMDSTRIT
ncbi:MAG: YhfC family glutamic-type intramembrane protease, partial [Paraburkholderia sp.]|uniref:YhfC family glutamic-type intramembrane protease n=1 Tax=Paraburkholderia sp. TaxID=1926495 RepID=UPI003C4408AA